MKYIWLQVGLVSESMLYVAFNLLTQAAHFNIFGFTVRDWIWGWNSWKHSETWELGTPKELPKYDVLSSKVVLFLRFISMY